MIGVLEVYNHDSKPSKSKILNSIFTEEENVSYHLTFILNDKRFCLNLYDDLVTLDEIDVDENIIDSLYYKDFGKD